MGIGDVDLGRIEAQRQDELLHVVVASVVFIERKLSDEVQRKFRFMRRIGRAPLEEADVAVDVERRRRREGLLREEDKLVPDIFQRGATD